MYFIDFIFCVNIIKILTVQTLPGGTVLTISGYGFSQDVVVQLGESHCDILAKSDAEQRNPAQQGFINKVLTTLCEVL